MRKCITTSMVTTAIGGIVVLASVATVFTQGYDWGQATIGIAAGVGLIFAKDANK